MQHQDNSKAEKLISEFESAVEQIPYVSLQEFQIMRDLVASSVRIASHKKSNDEVLSWLNHHAVRTENNFWDFWNKKIEVQNITSKLTNEEDGQCTRCLQFVPRSTLRSIRSEATTYVCCPDCQSWFGYRG